MQSSVLWRGSDPRLMPAALDIHRARPDLQKAFPDPATDDFWLWMNNHGVREYEQVRSLVPPIPPGPRMVTVCGSDELAGFVSVGAQTVKALQAAFRVGGRELGDF